MQQNTTCNTFKRTLEDLNPEEKLSSAEKNQASTSVVAQIVPTDILLTLHFGSNRAREGANICIISRLQWLLIIGCPFCWRFGWGNWVLLFLKGFYEIAITWVLVKENAKWRFAFVFNLLESDNRGRYFQLIPGLRVHCSNRWLLFLGRDLGELIYWTPVFIGTLFFCGARGVLFTFLFGLTYILGRDHGKFYFSRQFIKTWYFILTAFFF